MDSTSLIAFFCNNRSSSLLELLTSTRWSTSFSQPKVVIMFPSFNLNSRDATQESNDALSFGGLK